MIKYQGSITSARIDLSASCIELSPNSVFFYVHVYQGFKSLLQQVCFPALSVFVQYVYCRTDNASCNVQQIF